MTAIRTIVIHVVHALIALWSKMMVACAGLLNMTAGERTANTNKQREGMMDNMTLASKVEVKYLSYNMTRKDRYETKGT